MSLRINDVKKVLRDSGLEMDADDVVAVMRTRAPYRNLTRVQVAQSLGSLCDSDSDIIRTRLGLYQHVSRSTTPADPFSAAAIAPRRLVLGPPSPATSRAVPERPGPATAEQVAGAVVVVEVPHLAAALSHHAARPVTVSDPEGAVDYLCYLARLRLGRRDVEVAWCDGSVSAAAEATRRQWAGADLVLVASPQVVAETRITAGQLRRALIVWRYGDSQCDESAQSLPLAELLHCCAAPSEAEPAQSSAADAPDALTSAATVPGAAPLLGGPRPRRSMARPQAAALEANALAAAGAMLDDPQLDCLWFLSVVLYEQPVPGVTGAGNSHTLRRQANQLGGTYARRWWRVATDADHDQLTTGTNSKGFDLPHHLYPDLLRFAEKHHLPLHRSTILKDQLRRGFWNAVRALQRSNTSATGI